MKHPRLTALGRHVTLLALAPLALVSCEASRSRKADAGLAGDVAGAATQDAPSASDGQGGGGSAGAPDGLAGGEDSAARTDEAVCARWAADRTLDEGSWSGSVETCEPGDTSPAGRANALRIMNLYRWLAGLPEVETAASLDAKAQACALMMAANQQLSHNPPTSWECYTAAGAEAAGDSNISTQPGVASVDAYMVDSGNEETMGHRRWILSSGLGPIGLGSTSTASCMLVIGGGGSSGGASSATFAAWPPPGPVPLAGIAPETFPWSNVDDVGWTVQSDVIDLRGATVTVTMDGAPLTISTSALAQGYGSWTALRIVPTGWRSEAGRTYHVTVAVNGSVVIEYDVRVLGCPG
jgi:hypothetical protein